MSTTISCVIRTYNEAKFISRLIQTLKTQEYPKSEVEIIVIDSGSTDGTVEIVREHDVTLIEIPKKEFNFSKSLNLGIEKSTGDFVVILSAHSIPCENNWLQRILSHFEDEKVAGVYSRQVPWPDADILDALRIRNCFVETSQIYHRENYGGHIIFSNVASCIRRSVWEKHPFTLPAAEDQEWANWAIKKGYKIIYDAGVSVNHSHNEDCRQGARRLIELEKSGDIRLGRHRSMFLTYKQACGQIYKTIRLIILLNNSSLDKVKMILRCFKSSFWFIRDFNRKFN